jgi:carbon monoxide dehydrogenase subunit G
MELQNSFVVPSDIETAWETLQNVEGLAPCVPGATLESSDGQNFTGSVKVKLGPVAMTYGGQAHFVNLDKENWTAVIEGSGKETKGTGTAKGLVTAKLTAEAPDRTRVDVNTDLQITGKAAQFGRGVIQDVAGRIIDQFSNNLAATMTASGAVAAAAAAEAAAKVAEESGDAAAAEAAAKAKAEAEEAAKLAAAAPKVQAEDSIDLLGTAGAPVAKRAVPTVIVLALVAFLVWFFFFKK